MFFSVSEASAELRPNQMVAEWLELPRKKEDFFFSPNLLPDSPDDKNEISDSGDIFVTAHHDNS